MSPLTRHHVPYLHDGVVQRPAERGLHAALGVVVELGEDGLVEELPGDHLLRRAGREAVEARVFAQPLLLAAFHGALPQQLVHQAHLTQQLHLDTAHRDS